MIVVVLRAASITVNIRLIPIQHRILLSALPTLGRVVAGQSHTQPLADSVTPITRATLPLSVHIQGIHQAVQRVSGQGAGVHPLTRRHADVGIPIIPVIHQPSVRIQGIKRLFVQRIGGRVVAGQRHTRQRVDAGIRIIPVILMRFGRTGGISHTGTMARKASIVPLSKKGE